MWSEIFVFEIKYHLKQPLFYCAALVLSAFGLLLISTNAGVTFSDVPSVVNRNAPYQIVYSLTVLSLLGLFVVTAFVASSALRDFQRGTHMLFFTKPIKKYDYITGRFAGSMVISLLLTLCTAIGLAAGNFMPWQDVERLGPFTIGPYIHALVIQVLPNLLMMGALFFAVTIWSRRIIVAYLCVVAFLGLQDAAETLAMSFENASLGSLLEPMGLVALKTSARYWTIVEYNSLLPELTGGLLYNRLLWLSVGLLALAWSYARFSYSRANSKRSSKKNAPEPGAVIAPAQWAGIPRVARSFSIGSRLGQLLSTARLETTAVMRSTPFIVVLAMGLLLVFTSAYYTGQIRGTSVFPVTHLMLRAVQVSMQMFLVIIVIFYSGELIWRERALRMVGVRDSTPAPNWVLLGGKFLALVSITAFVVLTGILSTIAYQISRGYFQLEPALYAKGFLLITLSFVFLAAVSFFLQVISKNKFIGYLLMIIVLVVRRVLPELGFEHTLFRYGSHPPAPYSDMNGYGHFVEPLFWFNLHWSIACILILGFSAVFWVRGTESSLKNRILEARLRCRGSGLAALLLAAGAFFATGTFIYYNTNVRNKYLPPMHQEAVRAEYEREYRKYSQVPLPRITAVYAEVGIFPSERRVDIRGEYVLNNKTSAPIGSLHVTIDPSVVINEMHPGPHTEVLADAERGYYIYELDEPIRPGGEVEFRFNLALENRGFVNNDSNNHIVHNGTFFNNRRFFPALGYDSSGELIDRNKRRKYNLPPRPRMAKIDDLSARYNHYITSDSDWIDFETVVSTSADQIAIAPGYLQREWQDAGRRYFHYKMDSPIINFFSYLSADYAVRRDYWNDVVIEVYYHPPHEFNVDRMIYAVKKSLDYFTANFSPYQHRQVRIIEFPRYEHFAQSFPNTIPYSEGVGFIARIGDRDEIDYVFNTTAHEVAHQWWAHQVIGGNVQGATLMSESLAEYSALMVMEKEYGPANMRRFLKFELDGYLRGRSDELVEELPLMLVENQRYIHYNKGCLTMYALRDYLGEECLNNALAQYIDQVAFQQPPYTNSRELLACLRRATPDSLAYIIEDMFESITLFSNKVETATCSPLEDGRYLVSLEVEARKLRADGLGNEKQIAIDDWIDIGVFGEKEDGGIGEKVLFLEKRRISKEKTKFELIVGARPARAGIDPLNKLIDRDSDDNVKSVRLTSAPARGGR